MYTVEFGIHGKVNLCHTFDNAIGVFKVVHAELNPEEAKVLGEALIRYAETLLFNNEKARHLCTP